MIDVWEPRDEVLRKFVDSIYVLTRSSDKLEFTAYAGLNTPVAVLSNTAVYAEGGNVRITASDNPNYVAIACNQFFNSVHLQYEQLVDEIAINFKPLGFASFARSSVKDSKVFGFTQWNDHIPELFRQVFMVSDARLQLECIEQFLLQQYSPVQNEAVLLRTLALLQDHYCDYKMQEIAEFSGISYKQLYRIFTEHIGCSPAHYRKLFRFRRSVADKITEGNAIRLTDISHKHDYTDQAHFNRQFKELTGEKPTRFFSEVTAFGDTKVIFKIG